jgi:transposase InsO family protein
VVALEDLASPGAGKIDLVRMEGAAATGRTGGQEAAIGEPGCVAAGRRDSHRGVCPYPSEGRWYFFVSIIDGFSRYLIHWELLTSMRADDVSLVVQKALEKIPGVMPEIVSDNGSQYTSRDFKALIKQFHLHHIQIRIQHPESNGIVERLHRSLREGLSDQEMEDLSHAREIIGKWVAYYNNERLHAGIMYLRPRDYYLGHQEALLEERRMKLQKARARRRILNLQRRELWQVSEEENHTNLKIEKSPNSC